MPSSPRAPDLAAQRAAMTKLDFLVGSWAGEARLARGPGDIIRLVQTEEVAYKLDGLVLMIEGVGRAEPGEAPVLQALGIVSYEDESGAYHMRAFNDGRFLETEVRLSERGDGIEWGFTLGEIRTTSVLRINQRGEWTEVTEIAIGGHPPRRFLELTVTRRA